MSLKRFFTWNTANSLVKFVGERRTEGVVAATPIFIKF
jgi:hypothetical protein